MNFGDSKLVNSVSSSLGPLNSKSKDTFIT